MNDEGTVLNMESLNAMINKLEGIGVKPATPKDDRPWMNGHNFNSLNMPIVMVELSEICNVLREMNRRIGRIETVLNPPPVNTTNDWRKQYGG